MSSSLLLRLLPAVLGLALCSPGLAAPPDEKVTRGPYLQCATPAGIKIVWRTRTAGAPGVKFGPSPDALTQSLSADRIRLLRPSSDLAENAPDPVLASAPENTRQYEADLTGLTPDTLYYYSITLDGQPLCLPGPEYTFRTLPTPGTARDGLFWVVGDSGTGNSVQAQVHTAMRAWLKKENRSLDGYLHVGDMAYGSGLDSEFQGYFFESYAETLRNTVCWPSMGNHEGSHSSGRTAIGPYYDAYVTPTEGQSGGLASGTEAYYSFDFGKIHFICLNSHDLPRDPAGAMAQWLKADLEKTKADFLIAYWHHPPYTKGSHDSDTESQLIEMRSLIMPILESGGIDLVLTGHSHIYERSMLIDGAYITPTTSENVVLNDGDGNPAGNGAYHKSQGLRPYEGTVQIVAGNGGASISRQSAPSPIMRVTLLEYGSVLLDLKGSTLTASMLNADGEIRDTFQILKEGQVTVSRIAKPWQPPAFTGPKSVPPPPRPGSLKPAPALVLSKTAIPLIPPASIWQYLGGTKPAYGWQEPGFDATGWLSGPAGFGYSDNDDTTQIADMRSKYRYLCIRREFDLTGTGRPEHLRLNISYDDAFIAYLNGREVARANVETGALDTVRGVSPHEANNKFEIFSLAVPLGLLKTGKNVLAIEGYNDDLNSSDFTLNPSLYHDAPPAAAPDKAKE